MSKDAEENKKDTWDKWKIVLEPAGGFLTAMAVVFLTFRTSRELTSMQEQANSSRIALQERENTSRVYTELLGRREEAETGLRKAMFDSIMGAFLNSDASPKGATAGSEAKEDLEPDVLKLELLAYNFHDSLNLVPLFKHLERRIEKRLNAQPDDPVAMACVRRLRKVANDIVSKQLAILTAPDNKNVASLAEGIFRVPRENEPDPNNASECVEHSSTLTIEGITHEVTVSINAIAPRTQELQVGLTVRSATSTSPGSTGGRGHTRETRMEFWVGSFEFPMIDNTRLPNDQRCALVMKVDELDAAAKTFRYEVFVVCFPGSRAAMKDKPYYDEVLDRLRSANRAR